MTTTLDQFMIDHALRIAAMSPCRSKRGVALYDMHTGAFRGAGHNGPPVGGCPGRAVCAGTCGQRSVHAEVRALRAAETYLRNGHPPGPYDLIHVELATGLRIGVDRSPDGLPVGQAPYVVTSGGVVACDGPRCPGCAAQILDVGFVGGVWLYEAAQRERCFGGWAFGHRYISEFNVEVTCPACGGEGYIGPPGTWRRYTSEEFYRVTMERCGVPGNGTDRRRCACGAAPQLGEEPDEGLYEEDGEVRYLCGRCWAIANGTGTGPR